MKWSKLIEDINQEHCITLMISLIMQLMQYMYLKRNSFVLKQTKTGTEELHEEIRKVKWKG